MFTAAAASGPKTRKGRTATVRPLTKLLISSGPKDNTETLRLQRLRTAGVFGAPAEMLAAMALLTSGPALRAKEGQFLGGIAVDANPLTEKQSNWLAILLARHDLPPLADEGARA